MSRRRYVSTDISLDPAVNRVSKRSDFAALLYTWMIPHANDDATITGDPERLMMLVMPGRRDKDPKDIEAALGLLEAEGLFELWSRVTGTIYLWPATFYRYQTYIKPANRRTEAADAVEQRKTPQNTASLSPSHSPSHSHSPTEESVSDADASASQSALLDTTAAVQPDASKTDEERSDLFAEFWSAWPNRKGSKQLASRRFKALSAPQQRKAIAGAGYLAEALERGLIESVTYQPRAENFVGGSKRYFEEWCDGIPEHLEAGSRRLSAFGGLREVARQLEGEAAV